MANVLAGISFPFRIEGNGLPAAAKSVDVIRSALMVLLRTKKRTRVMRPEVGMNLHRLIFEDEGPLLQSLITREILSQIGAQLPQVSVTNIQFDTSVPKVIAVNVKYTVQGVSDQTGFVTVTS